MRRLISRIFISIVSFVGFIQLSYGQSANNQHCADPSSSLLWTIEGKQSTVTLFGSLHLGTADFYPLAAEVEQAFRSANHLVFEVDPGAAMNPEFALRMQQQGMLAANEQLSDYLSPQIIAQLKLALQDLGLPAAPLMRFKPWFLTLMLTSQQMVSMGYLPTYGAESYLMREKSATSAVMELESLEEQLNFLAALDGEAYLAFTLNNMEAGKEQMEQMVKAWACADKPLLTELLVDSFEMEGFDKKELESLKDIFLTDRNRLMANKIETFIQTGQGDYFVAVGAAHYLGDESIISFLKDKGYKVKEVKIIAQ